MDYTRPPGARRVREPPDVDGDHLDGAVPRREVPRDLVEDRPPHGPVEVYKRSAQEHRSSSSQGIGHEIFWDDPGAALEVTHAALTRTARAPAGTSVGCPCREQSRVAPAERTALAIMLGRVSACRQPLGFHEQTQEEAGDAR